MASESEDIYDGLTDREKDEVNRRVAGYRRSHPKANQQRLHEVAARFAQEIRDAREPDDKSDDTGGTKRRK